MKGRAVLVAILLALVGRPLAQADLTDGLVAYWLLDENSGSTAVDTRASTTRGSRREKWDEGVKWGYEKPLSNLKSGHLC